MSAAATWAAREQVLLDAAREGDEDAYRRLIEPRRAELHAHCYRMLGSVQDAEDALQDALLRAWRALPRFERRSSIRSWLYQDRDQHLPRPDRPAAQARAADRLRPRLGPARRPGDAARRIGLDRALPGRAARAAGRARGTRGALRAARERRAGVRRGAPAPAGTPARGADHARGARLLGQGGRGGARDDGRRRSTARSSARARRSTSDSRRPASRRRCARSATRP